MVNNNKKKYATIQNVEVPSPWRDMIQRNF